MSETNCELLLQSPWYRAFSETLTTMCLCVSFIGIGFLPGELQRLTAGPMEMPISCTPLSDGKAVAILVQVTHTEDSLVRQTKCIRWLATGRQGGLPHALELPGNVACVAIHPSGAKVLCWDSNGGLSAIKVSGAGAGRVHLGHSSKPESMACTPDGQFLLVASGDGLRAWNLKRDPFDVAPPFLKVTDERIECFAACHESETVVVGKSTAAGSRLVDIDVATGASLCVTEIPLHPAKLVVSPDGKHLAAVQENGEMLLYRRNSANGAWLPESLAGLRTGPWHIAAFSADSRRLVTGDPFGAYLTIWDMTLHAASHRLHSGFDPVLGCDFVDTSRLVTWGLSNTPTILSTEAQPPTQTIAVWDLW